jgi:hypothetical protein
VRLFALLVGVLALGAQQRVVRAVHIVPVSASHVVSERPETIESKALRAESSLRVAPAPVLERVPVALLSMRASRLPSTRRLVTRSASVERAQLVTHFHAKRRIPRMNSEEPPRG